MKYLIMTVTLLLASPTWAAPSDDALVALARGDYATALKIIRPLAAKGEAWAQFNLGLMYNIAQGVTQDYAAAMSWYRKAAEQDDAYAQTNLGVMYYSGRGVPQDYVQAHMWWSLAAAKGDADAINNLDQIAAKMTPAQIAEAQKLAREWKPK